MTSTLVGDAVTEIELLFCDQIYFQNYPEMIWWASISYFPWKKSDHDKDVIVPGANTKYKTYIKLRLA